MNRIGIVTPSFNQVDFLKACINSVIQQKNDNFSLHYAVMDGGSVDGSKELIAAYNDCLEFWESGPDGGPSNALNSAFQRLDVDIQGYLNSDDMYFPGALSRVAEEFSKDDSVDFVFGNVWFLGSNGEKLRPPGRGLTLQAALNFSPEDICSGNYVIPQQGCFWRKSAFVKLGGFNPQNKTCWDYELFVKAVLKGMKFKAINYDVAGFRIHSASITGSGRLSAVYEQDKRRIARECGVEWPAKSGIVRRFYRRNKFRALKVIRQIL